MEKLTKEQIKEIADWVNYGMKCFLNPKTFEYVVFQDEDNLDLSDNEEDPYLEDRRKMKVWKEAEEIVGMTSRESFQLMEDFADTIPDKEPLKSQLFLALERKSPFRNFKDTIEGSDYRQAWFDFRADAWLKHTSDQVDAIIHRDDAGWNRKVYDEE